MFRSISKLLFLIALGAACATSVWSKTITIGILDTIDPWFYVQTFGPTMEHLRKVIPQYEIKSVELSFENLHKAISLLLRVDSLPMWQNLPARAILQHAIRKEPKILLNL